MNLTVEELLVGLSTKCGGDWGKVWNILKTKEMIAREDVVDAVNSTKSSYVCVTSGAYPDSFKYVTHPPFIIYYYGNFNLLNAKRRIAVAGSDDPTDSDDNVIIQAFRIQKVVSGIAEKYGNDCVIVSDYERRLSAVALRTAMKAGLPIIVVMSSGIDNPNEPEENKDIYDYCKSGKGLIISEYPNDVSFDVDHRDFSARLIDALATE